MKYNIIQIKPKNTEEWEVVIWKDDEDRVDEHSEPSGLGYYYSPVKEGAKRGFEKLKNHLIRKHKEEIKHLNKSLKALNNISYNMIKKNEI